MGFFCYNPTLFFSTDFNELKYKHVLRKPLTTVVQWQVTPHVHFLCALTQAMCARICIKLSFSQSVCPDVYSPLPGNL